MTSETQPKPNRLKVAGLSLLLLMLVTLPASAISFNVSAMQVLLINLSSVILPQFLNLVIAYLPIAVTLAILGFILTFLDKILGAIR